VIELRTALLVIDMIREFVTGSLGGAHAQAVVPCISRLVEAARRGGSPVVYVTDAHLEGVDHEFDVWGSHAVAGSPEAEMVPELEPEKGEHRLYKRRYSAFYATGLDALLRELKVDTVVLTGVLTNICIQHTAADAFFRGYKVVVPTDCVNALTPGEQETSLAFMKRMYNAMLNDSGEAMEMLEASS
jgi:nicotinamidase-related amidase